jgi:hypothetical protein
LNHGYDKRGFALLGAKDWFMARVLAYRRLRECSKLHYSLLEIWKVVVRRIERVLVSSVMYCPRNASIPSTLHLQLSFHILDCKIAWALELGISNLSSKTMAAPRDVTANSIFQRPSTFQRSPKSHCTPTALSQRSHSCLAFLPKSFSPNAPLSKSTKLVLLTPHSQNPPPFILLPSAASQLPIRLPWSVSTATYLSVAFSVANSGFDNHVRHVTSNLPKIAVDAKPGVNACAER